MRVAVIGSRDYPRLSDVDGLVATFSPEVVVVSGGARGVDQRAVACATTRGLKTEVFSADWETHGKKAGLLRNVEVIQTTQRVYAFWDGVSTGTAHALDVATKRGIPTEVHRWQPTAADMPEFLAELRAMYHAAAKTGHTSSPAFVRMVNWLKSEDLWKSRGGTA